jgi:hypothetical protein
MEVKEMLLRIEDMIEKIENDNEVDWVFRKGYVYSLKEVKTILEVELKNLK